MMGALKGTEPRGPCDERRHAKKNPALGTITHSPRQHKRTDRNGNNGAEAAGRLPDDLIERVIVKACCDEHTSEEPQCSNGAATFHNA